jgi:6-phosphogluconolactonase
MARPPETRIEVLADAEALAQRAAEWLTGLAVVGPERFAIALSGGSTPKRLYEILAAAPYIDRFPWPRVHLFWGDERCVPHDHPDSNFNMTRKAMLARVPLPAGNIHAVPTEGISPEAAAASYDAELRRFYGADALDPARRLFDVTLIGLGPDGHIASLFPGSAALNERASWVTAVTDSVKYGPRISLTYPAIEASHHVAFLISGAGKREILGRLRAGDETLPAAHLHPRGETCWFVDRAASPDA